MNGLIFDLVIAVVLILSVMQGYRKGLILTLCGFLAVFVAFIGATLLSDALAEPVSHAIQPVIEQQVTQVIEQGLKEQGFLYNDASMTDSSLQEWTQSLTQQLSLDEVVVFLQELPVLSNLVETIQTTIGSELSNIASSAATTVSNYLAYEVTRMVLFTLSFVVVMVIWNLLSRTLDFAFRIPVLSTVNDWGGAIVGLVRGSALMFIACWLLRGLIAPETITNSLLLQFFCTTNPFTLLASFLQGFTASSQL